MCLKRKSLNVIKRVLMKVVEIGIFMGWVVIDILGELLKIDRGN